MSVTDTINIGNLQVKFLACQAVFVVITVYSSNSSSLDFCFNLKSALSRSKRFEKISL